MTEYGFSVLRCNLTEYEIFFVNTGCGASMKSTEFSLSLVVDRIVTFLSGILGMNVENLGVCSFIYVKGKLLCAVRKRTS